MKVILFKYLNSNIKYTIKYIIKYTIYNLFIDRASAHNVSNFISLQ